MPSKIPQPKKESKNVSKKEVKQKHILEEDILRQHTPKKLLSQLTISLSFSITPMTQPTTLPGVTGMPVAGTKHAPEFDSKNPEELKEFLEEFEDLAGRNGLTAKGKAKMVVKYVDQETRALWKRLEVYNNDYDMLKQKS